MSAGVRHGRDGVSSHSLRKPRSPVRERRVVLGLLDQPIVLGVEDGVDGGQADVLVHAASPAI